MERCASYFRVLTRMPATRTRLILTTAIATLLGVSERDALDMSAYLLAH